MSEEVAEAGIDLLELTARVVTAYVGNNALSAGDLPRLITDTYIAVSGLQSDSATPQPEEKLVPAVPIRKSVTPSFIICLEDGKPFKSLKRHLATHFDLTPDAYRAKWGLPADYPMTAPNYSAARSQVARAAGLGRKAKPVAEPVKPAANSPRKKLGLKLG
jgi:predicted transcriptional regulator